MAEPRHSSQRRPQILDQWLERLKTDRMAIATVRNLLSVLDGKPDHENVVNKEVLE